MSPTDAAFPRLVVQSCRSAAISGTGGPAQSCVLSGSCPDTSALLQP